MRRLRLRRYSPLQEQRRTRNSGSSCPWIRVGRKRRSVDSGQHLGDRRRQIQACLQTACPRCTGLKRCQAATLGMHVCRLLATQAQY
ncbi:hypothetical protein CCHR01_05551 [Colletotrichum chrysophilum]|uniref:Uncharacterized protein n=1 Tax=Colletotrichum chrysophilum TaxID=1836956 RepID=A0AAD9AP48_9PEZI|nr:hypothetical protein CCHR01_05551 [Colletotrichum chrysophilum]